MYEPQRDAVASGASHTLPALPSTCFWAYFDNSLPAVLTVESGDVVSLELVTHQAGDAPDLMMDDGVRAVYEGIPPSTRTPGVHIMTGPVSIKDAEPGDALQVDILEIRPRLAYGTNIAAWWGYLYHEFSKERITIYHVDTDAGVARPAFAFDYQTSPLYNQPGVLIPPDPAARQPVLARVAVPLRPHIGVMGVAPREDGRVNSIPPGAFGGNIDNWRIGVGASMYYPVFHTGALFFAGDPHMAEGDGELSGTALECSANVRLRLSVRKDMHLTGPLLETASHWYTHGFDAGTPGAAGPGSPAEVSSPPPGDLNQAMRQAALEMLTFLTETQHLSRDDAYSLMSLAADFGVTQVVDYRQGVHCGIPKSVFSSA
jgi:acetamidase/formamidase